MFDPTAFTQQTITEEGATRLDNPPDGEYIVFVDGEIAVEKWVYGVEVKSGDRTGQTVPKVRIPLRVEATPELKKKLGRERIIVFLDKFLDVKGDGRTIDMDPGRNLVLNQLRAAVGMNKSGGAFSLPMLANAGPALAILKSRPNETDPDRPYQDVVRIAPVRR